MIKIDTHQSNSINIELHSGKFQHWSNLALHGWTRHGFPGRKGIKSCTRLPKSWWVSFVSITISPSSKVVRKYFLCSAAARMVIRQWINLFWHLNSELYSQTHFLCQALSLRSVGLSSSTHGQVLQRWGTINIHFLRSCSVAQYYFTLTCVGDVKIYLKKILQYFADSTFTAGMRTIQEPDKLIQEMQTDSWV